MSEQCRKKIGHRTDLCCREAGHKGSCSSQTEELWTKANHQPNPSSYQDTVYGGGCKGWSDALKVHCRRASGHIGFCEFPSECISPVVIPHYEHKILELRLYATEAELNQLGSEGWQLVSESVHEDQVRYVFCRAKQP